ncbi:MAG: hypothetical protein DMG60_19760 [Acidobacteria bacterium]|nr:MAG: hypothetical protein DMG60_19760 [Acidobacteriota bacterium]
MSEARTLLLSAIVIPTGLVAGQRKADNASSPNPQRPSSERNHDTKISIKIGGKILSATLVNNQTARDFVSLLPLNLSMDEGDYRGCEVRHTNIERPRFHRKGRK